MLGVILQFLYESINQFVCRCMLLSLLLFSEIQKKKNLEDPTKSL